MFDIKWVRENADLFDQGLAKRGLDPLAASLLAIDDERKTIIGALQEAQERRNAASKAIGKAKASGNEEEAKRLIDEVAATKAQIQSNEHKQRDVEARLRSALSVIPNLPLADVPQGVDEADNVEVRVVGKRPAVNDPKPHYDIGEALGMMDFETAAKLSGSRFVVLRSQLARLERAIANFMIDTHTEQFGYEEIIPPLLVRDEVVEGTGQLPKFQDDLFVASSQSARNDLLKDALSNLDRTAFQHELEQSDNVWDALEPHLTNAKTQEQFWMIPTAEVPLTNFVREAIVEEGELPMRLTAWTPCFRSEAGAAGRDTRGMIRQHQFSKVELVSITTPEQSNDELERMVGCAEHVLKALDLHYRVMTLSTGDMGFAARKTYDLEVWLPSQNTFREISSCSTCGDFQARRMNARYRQADGGGVNYVHTLNGSGLAVGRMLVAILENYLNADGSVTIPAALRRYMAGAEKIAAK